MASNRTPDFSFNFFATVTVCLMLLGPMASMARADEPPGESESILRLRSHEPNLLGYTWDESGQFMDFTLSVKFKIFERTIRNFSPPSSLNFAFTGRFGQYFERSSAPVIGKRYNPELFYRHDSDDSYWETGYAHESNGQQITTLAGYQQAQATLEQPEYANDYISRGWDYVRFTYQSRVLENLGADHPVLLWATGKWFLRNGLFQGQPEEYNDWENNPEGKPRNQVDGITAGIRYIPRTSLSWLPVGNVSFTYTTGYREIFRYNTYRLEAGVKIVDLPLVFWAAHGYNNDLARYYRELSAWGVAIEIGGF
jgi:outer membrane phospholipase A